MATICYTQKFVGGLLAGLTYPAELTCAGDNPDTLLAEYKALEASGRVIQPCVGSSSYTIHDVHLKQVGILDTPIAIVDLAAINR